jgi:Ca2+-binding EF-hand superfamily protein
MEDKWKADFKVMDIDGKGRITISNLKRILNHEL